MDLAHGLVAAAQAVMSCWVAGAAPDMPGAHSLAHMCSCTLSLDQSCYQCGSRSMNPPTAVAFFAPEVWTWQLLAASTAAQTCLAVFGLGHWVFGGGRGGGGSITAAGRFMLPCWLQLAAVASSAPSLHLELRLAN